MVQGILANCWFAAAINASAKADRTIITHAFFPEQRMADGLFGVNIFLEGFARMVKVDNFVPTHDGAPIFSNLKDSNVVWPLLDEKAVCSDFWWLPQAQRRSLPIVLAFFRSCGC